MIFISRIIAVILALTMLQSCTGMNKQGGGTIIGGVTGALLGSRFGKGSGALAATGVGALVGAFAGSMIGKSMDDQDRRLAELASQRALETGASGSNVEWRNPDNGNYGYVTPTKTFRNDHGRYCREYNQVVVIGGKQEKAYGTACRQPDGHWEIAK